VELATTADFPTIDAYAADLAARQLSFATDPLAAEFEARDPVTSGLVTVRLEHRPERRVIGGVEQTIAEALDHGLMESPWVTWTAAEQRLRLERDCYPRLEYDWDDGTVVESQAPSGCGESAPDAGVGGSGADAGTGGSSADAGAGLEPAVEDDDGCGCSLPGRERTGGPALWLVLAAIGAGLRRRSTL
jgi:hypothetical protein